MQGSLFIDVIAQAMIVLGSVIFVYCVYRSIKK
jgi:hypothetical protein